MAGALMNIRIDDREVKDLFARLKGKVRDLTPAMKVIEWGEFIRTLTKGEEGGVKLF